MAVRTAEAICALRNRTEVGYFGNDESEEDDLVKYEEETSSTEQECDDYTISYENNGSNDEAEQEPKQDDNNSRHKYIYGKDKTKWSTKLAENREKQSAPRTIHFATPTPSAMNVSSPLEAWNLFFTDEILDAIVKHSNEERERKIMNMNEDGRVKSSYAIIDVVELRAFIGLLFYAGVCRQGKTLLAEIWSTEYGMNLFVSTMSIQRFEFISSILRFDDRSTRTFRRANDVLAPIREIWDLFIAQCESNYSPSNSVSIGEQLLGFRGKFSAKVYIKSKPARYGIKVVCMNDAKTSYMLNAIPHTGNIICDHDEKVPEYYVRVLSEPIKNTGRTVTLGKSFTTIRTCNRMKNEWGLDVVGNIRKNEREIPISFTRPAAVGTSRYAYDHANKIALLSFVQKKNKIVLLVSSVHKKGISGYSGTPEIVELYNNTKSRVDTFDKMISSYTVARKTKLWPVRLFFAILDQSGINAFVIYNLIERNGALTRLNFLKKLSLQLVRPHMERRVSSSGLHKLIKMSIHQILGTNGISTKYTNKLSKRKRCYLCATAEDRKTNQCCSRCGNTVCEEHRANLCNNCL